MYLVDETSHCPYMYVTKHALLEHFSGLNFQWCNNYIYNYRVLWLRHADHHLWSFSCLSTDHDDTNKLRTNILQPASHIIV